MVVSLNTALVSKSSSNIAFGNSHKNSVRLAPQEGDKFLSTGITHQKSLVQKARTLAVAALAMFGAYSCTPGSNDEPNIPPVIKPDSTVVVPTIKLTDGQKMPIAYYGEVGVIDTLKEKGPLNQLDYHDSGTLYDHSLKFEYPTDGSKKYTVIDRLIYNGDTVQQEKEVLVPDVTNPKLFKAESHASLENGKWVEAYSKFSHLIGNGSVTDIMDGKQYAKITKDTPIKLNGLDLVHDYKYVLNVTKKVMGTVK